MKVGAMIEIPAAVLLLPPFLRRMDFLSIGTDDLAQYYRAIGRADNAVAHLFDPMHPAVLQPTAPHHPRNGDRRRGASGGVRRNGGETQA
ncbi:putative PEP-binding protein [Cupriavidus basilensis]